MVTHGEVGARHIAGGYRVENPALFRLDLFQPLPGAAPGDFQRHARSGTRRGVQRIQEADVKLVAGSLGNGHVKIEIRPLGGFVACLSSEVLCGSAGDIAGISVVGISATKMAA